MQVQVVKKKHRMQAPQGQRFAGAAGDKQPRPILHLKLGSAHDALA